MLFLHTSWTKNCGDFFWLLGYKYFKKSSNSRKAFRVQMFMLVYGDTINVDFINGVLKGMNGSSPRFPVLWQFFRCQISRAFVITFKLFWYLWQIMAATQRQTSLGVAANSSQTNTESVWNSPSVLSLPFWSLVLTSPY